MHSLKDWICQMERNPSLQEQLHWGAVLVILSLLLIKCSTTTISFLQSDTWKQVWNGRLVRESPLFTDHCVTANGSSFYLGVTVRVMLDVGQVVLGVLKVSFPSSYFSSINKLGYTRELAGTVTMWMRYCFVK
jgi:hypothetical protein